MLRGRPVTELGRSSSGTGWRSELRVIEQLSALDRSGNRMIEYVHENHLVFLSRWLGGQQEAQRGDSIGKHGGSDNRLRTSWNRSTVGANCWGAQRNLYSVHGGLSIIIL
jgi:hypothetical protein